MQHNSTSSSHKRIGIVISDGVGFRNFILSDFIKEVKSTFDEVIIFSCLPISVFTEFELNCEIIEIEPFKESYFTWMFRKGKELAHLQKFATHNFGMNDNLQANRNKALNARGIMTSFLFFWTTYFHSEWWIRLFYSLQEFTYRFNAQHHSYKTLLKKHSVDLLFFTHQRPPFIAPLISLARTFNIKTASFIFSWDNLASKGRMAGEFDSYLVWSELMKTELLFYYESITEQQIYVVGTPQFEPYVLDRYASNKESFVKRFNLNPNYKTIYFSCGDISTSRNDEHYIETIASFIDKNQLNEPVNFIVRTSPAESPERFYFLRERHPEIIWNYPKWLQSRPNHQEPWSQRVPLVEDVIMLRSLLAFSDVNINMCSTMSLDFMLFNKPVINPVFGNTDNGLYDDQRFLKYTHYEKVIESNAVILAKNEKELLDGINEALKNPDTKRKEQAFILNLEIGQELRHTGKRIAQTLSSLIRKN